MATAAEKRAKSAKGHRRDDRPENLWTKKHTPLDYGLESYSLIADREERKLARLSLDPFATHANWERQGSGLVGEVTITVPEGKVGIGIIAKGDVVECWRLRGKARALQWRMEVSSDPDHQLPDGTMGLALKTASKPLEESRTGWKRPREKAHVRARAAARRFGIRVGRLAVGRVLLPKLIDKKASVVDVVTKAYAEERKRTGRRFTIDTAFGSLDVREIRYPDYMTVLGPAILSTTLKHSLSNFATTLIVVSSSKRKAGGRAQKKLRVRVSDTARRKRYGEIVKTVKAPSTLTTRKQLEKWGREELRRIHRPLTEIEIEHPLIPKLDKGDAIKLHVPEHDLTTVCYVKAVRADLSAGSANMSVTLGVDDPYVDEAEKAKKRKKQEAARKRSRRRGEHAEPRKTKKARRRGDTVLAEDGSRVPASFYAGERG